MAPQYIVKCEIKVKNVQIIKAIKFIGESFLKLPGKLDVTAAQEQSTLKYMTTYANN